MVNLAKRLKEIRESMSLTQLEVSKGIKVERYIVSNWETGRTEPSLQDIKNLADFYQVTADFLLGREDDFGNLILPVSFEQLPQAEIELLKGYRKLSKIQKQAVDLQIKALLSK